jgi:hypothetical protein
MQQLAVQLSWLSDIWHFRARIQNGLVRVLSRDKLRHAVVGHDAPYDRNVDILIRLARAAPNRFTSSMN